MKNAFKYAGIYLWHNAPLVAISLMFTALGSTRYYGETFSYILQWAGCIFLGIVLGLTLAIFIDEIARPR